MCLPSIAFSAVAMQVLYKINVSLARHLIPTCLKRPVSESGSASSVFFLDVEVIATVLTKQIHPEADLHFRVGVQNSQLALSRRF